MSFLSSLKSLFGSSSRPPAQTPPQENAPGKRDFFAETDHLLNTVFLELCRKDPECGAYLAANGGQSSFAMMTLAVNRLSGYIDAKSPALRQGDAVAAWQVLLDAFHRHGPALEQAAKDIVAKDYRAAKTWRKIGEKIAAFDRQQLPPAERPRLRL